MSERQKQTAFLKTLMGFEDSEQRRILHERIMKAERDERCLRRALFLVSLFGFVCLCGLGYASVLLPEFFSNHSHRLTRLLCALGLGSLFCFVSFLGYWIWHRSVLDGLHDECRGVVANLMLARAQPNPLPSALPPPASRVS
jgi:hypothetical protein